MELFQFTKIVDTAMLYSGDYERRFLWLSVTIGAVLFAGVYMLEAIALYTIAKRGGYKHKWFAFVPFLNTYYIGVLSEKNRIFNAKAKYFSLAAAIFEAVYFVLSTISLVAMFLIFYGGYAEPQFEEAIVGGRGYTVFTSSYLSINLPESLEWAWEYYRIYVGYVDYFLEIIWVGLQVFILSAFFRTYASPRYMLFTILSAIFPIKGIFMFCVRNNRPKNYGEYVRERRRMQYQAYQAYMQNHGGYPRGDDGNPSGGAPKKDEPDDPFGGLGGNGTNSYNGKSSPDDPFGDLS